jgi:hypothetical protein
VSSIDEVDLLKRAVAALEQASVPGDLRTLAFAKVLDLLVSAPSARTGHGNGGETTTRKVAGEEPSDSIALIASKIGIPAALMDRVLDEHEGELIFSGDVSSLGSSKFEKVHALALLLLAGRRWAGLDTGGTTPDEVLRAEVDRHGLLDVTNYTKHIATLKPFVIIAGSGKNAAYKIKYDGLEKAKQLGRALAGEE